MTAWRIYKDSANSLSMDKRNFGYLNFSTDHLLQRRGSLAVRLRNEPENSATRSCETGARKSSRWPRQRFANEKKTACLLPIICILIYNISYHRHNIALRFIANLYMRVYYLYLRWPRFVLSFADENRDRSRGTCASRYIVYKI